MRIRYWIIYLVACVLSVTIGAQLGKYSGHDKMPYELLEWTDGSGAKSCIWIDGQAYYGEHVENIAGSGKFIVYRGDDYLVLPEKTIVRTVE